MIKSRRLLYIVALGVVNAMWWPVSAQLPDIDQAIAQGRFEYARSLVRAQLTVEPYSTDRGELADALADTYFFEGDYQRAADAYAAVDQESLTGYRLVMYRYRYGYSLLQLRDYDGAGKMFADMPSYSSHGISNAALFYRGYIAFVQEDYSEAAQLLERVDDSSGPGVARDFYLAQIQYIRGNTGKALALARRASRLDLPRDLAAENQRVIGECLYMQDDAAAAIPYLRRYVASVDVPALSALYILGLSQYDEAMYDEAVRSLSPVAAGEDAMAQSACLYIGQAQLKSGDTDAAILSFDKALRIDADPAVSEAAYYNYAVARTRGGQVPFGSSVSTFENFLRRYPRSVYASAVREYLVNGYITDHDYESALRCIEAVPDPSPSIFAAKQRVLYAMGARDLAAGHPVTALEYLKQARRYSKYDTEIDAETYMLSGDANYRLGNYIEAIADYRRYLVSASAGAANIPLAHYNLGYAYFSDKKFAEASGEFTKAAAAASLAPAVRADACNRLGDIRYYASDFAGAQEQYARAFDMNSATGDYALFQTAAMQGFVRDYSRKIATLERLTKLFPQSALLPSAYLEKAETYLQLGRADDAIDTYRLLVDRYPSTQAGRNGYLQLAQTMENRGQSQSAEDAYMDIIRRYPSSDEARLATVALKRSFAEDDRIEELVGFLQSVPGAPEIDSSEVDRMAFDAAEAAYNDNSDVSRLKTYLRNYPDGAYVAQALGYLAADAFDSADDDNALAYAGRLVDNYPDALATENALSIKAEILLSRGETEEALDAYRSLLERTSSPARNATARIGIMRVARELGQWADVVAQADALLASSVPSGEQKTEIVFSRAEARERLGQEAEAVKDFRSLATHTDDVYGARAAVALGELYFKSDNLEQAKAVAEKFVASRSPHSYWLARGFILLSDVNRALGRDFEADEYLTALRRNYPGDDQDIFEMIDQRLKK